MFSGKKFQVATIVLLAVLVLHVRKMYEQQNPQCPQLMSWFGKEKDSA
jgi:hypothetical protein